MMTLVLNAGIANHMSVLVSAKPCCGHAWQYSNPLNSLHCSASSHTHHTTASSGSTSSFKNQRMVPMNRSVCCSPPMSSSRWCIKLNSPNTMGSTPSLTVDCPVPLTPTACPQGSSVVAHPPDSCVAHPPTLGVVPSPSLLMACPLALLSLGVSLRLLLVAHLCPLSVASLPSSLMASLLALLLLGEPQSQAPVAHGLSVCLSVYG